MSLSLEPGRIYGLIGPNGSGKTTLFNCITGIDPPDAGIIAFQHRRIDGLPPTPIMTVTEQSLRAALAPADVPYLFYVTGKDGVTYYATTLAEHEANIRAHGVRGE